MTTALLNSVRHLCCGVLAFCCTSASLAPSAPLHKRKTPAVAPPAKSISQTLAGMKNESEFFSALETAQVEALLDGPNTFKFTVFAPSNAAFARLKAGDHRNVFEPANLRKLRAIMSFHMVSGQFSKAAFKDGQEVMTSHGTNNLKIVRRGNRVWISGGTPAPVELRTSEINCDNGVIYVIDEVLLPLAWHKAPAASPRP